MRSIWVLWTMAWHYITFAGRRKKYHVNDTNYERETKQEYREKIYRMLQELSRRMIRAAGTEVVITGKENLPTEGPVVYMATHKGVYDSPIIASIIEDPAIFIGKNEVKKMPIFGKWFEAMDCIYIERDDMRQSLEAIMKGIDELKQGQSIVIFPEGTRSKGLEMGEFKAGSFKLATKAKVPIIPIAIQNTQKVLEEKGYIQKTTVYVNIGERIETKDLSGAEQKELPRKVQEHVEALLAEVTHNN